MVTVVDIGSLERKFLDYGFSDLRYFNATQPEMHAVLARK
jgi:hypothetical protein